METPDSDSLVSAIYLPNYYDMNMIMKSISFFNCHFNNNSIMYWMFFVGKIYTLYNQRLKYENNQKAIKNVLNEFT